MGRNILNDYFENYKLDFNKIQAQIDKIKIITHPIRYAIILMLIKNKEMTVTDIQNKLSMQQSTISNHLKLMKDYSLLITKRNGKNIYYTVNSKKVKKLLENMRIEIIDE